MNISFLYVISTRIFNLVIIPPYTRFLCDIIKTNVFNSVSTDFLSNRIFREAIYFTYNIKVNIISHIIAIRIFSNILKLTLSFLVYLVLKCIGSRTNHHCRVYLLLFGDMQCQMCRTDYLCCSLSVKCFTMPYKRYFI